MQMLYLKSGFSSPNSLKPITYCCLCSGNFGKYTFSVNFQTQLYIYTLLIASVLWVCIWCVDIFIMFLPACCEKQRPNRVLENGCSLSVLTADFCFLWTVLFELQSHPIMHEPTSFFFLVTAMSAALVVNEPHRILRKGLAFGIHVHTNLCHTIKKESLTESPFGINRSKRGLMNTGRAHRGLYLYHLEDPMSKNILSL